MKYLAPIVMLLAAAGMLTANGSACATTAERKPPNAALADTARHTNTVELLYVSLSMGLLFRRPTL